MTKEEIVEAISNDKMMPYIQPVRLSEIVNFVIKNYKPSLPSNLDEAAEKYAKNRVKDPERCYEYLYYEIIDAVEFGAKWIAGQGHRQTERVYNFDGENTPCLSPVIYLPKEFEIGDKVIVQVRKEE